jgi:hypothetical protein
MWVRCDGDKEVKRAGCKRKKRRKGRRASR